METSIIVSEKLLVRTGYSSLKRLFRDCPTLFLKELAAPFKYSEYYLSRKFSQEMGVGLKDYIRRQRLEQAKALLKDTDLEICEVSDRLRFCSPSYFSEQFKSEYGVSPTQL